MHGVIFDEKSNAGGQSFVFQRRIRLCAIVLSGNNWQPIVQRVAGANAWSFRSFQHMCPTGLVEQRSIGDYSGPSQLG